MSKTLTALVLLTLSWPAVSAAEEPPQPDRSEKTASWKPELLEPGQGWWCRPRGRCDRDRELCQAAGNDPPCVRQKRAWAFSFYWWGNERLSPIWIDAQWSTRAKCDEDRAAALSEEDSTSVSPCTAVGDKREPYRKRAVLPRGTGWWCFRYRNPVLGADTSTCVRTRAQCTEGMDRLSAPAFRKVVGEIATTSECQRRKVAWASEAGGPEPMFMIFDSEADCQANMIGGPCKRVR